jgi:ABC-type Fe3+ transport system permease subunit
MLFIMRSSGWLIPCAAIVLWLAAILWPLAAAIEVVLAQPRTDTHMHQAFRMVFISGGWGLAVALIAMLIGWAPGRWLGSTIRRRGFVPLAILMLVPIILPAYVVFYAWWSFWPADTGLFRWAVEHGQAQNVRYATLLVGFVCWSWPIVAWCVAGSVSSVPAQREELLRLDGATLFTRIADRLHRDARGLLVGGLIVFVATFNNTVCFDLAEIASFGNELFAMAAMGASPTDIFIAALPATLLTVCGAVAIWWLLGAGRAQTAVRTAPAHGGSVMFTLVIWLLAVVLPLALLARNMLTGPHGGDLGAQLDQFWRFYSRGLQNTLLMSLAAGTLAMIVAVGLAWMWQDRRGWVRMLAHVQAIGWIIAAAVPGTLYGQSLTAAYNRGELAEAIYLQPTILMIGYLGRFAFLGALLGRWMAMREPAGERDLRAIDGATGLLSYLRTAAAARGCGGDLRYRAGSIIERDSGDGVRAAAGL